MVSRYLCRLSWLLFGLVNWLPLAVWAAEPPPAPPAFEIALPAAWVRSFTANAAPSSDQYRGGISYLLLDQQQNLEPSAFYYHQARRITSQDGVQNGAAITVSFDPSYQKLTFHFIRLVRAESAMDRLDRSQIKVFQRETEMESFLYDGAFTAQCQLEDVRVGDVIEFAYTIEGANPVLKGKYFDIFSTEWSLPVRDAVIRIVYPAERTLFFQVKNREIKPATSTQHGRTEWLWEDKEIPARLMDNNTPLGYNPYGSVQVSEFATWREVVDWAIPLYPVDAPKSDDLAREIERLRAIPDREERILAALRFVQEEVRYLGIESGVGSHQPTPPSEVLRRRFGDCKDKSLLLATLLRNTGIAASPALVSTYHRKGVADRLPSPDGFNHVILKVESGTGTSWLDATRSAQKGPLSQIYSRNFGFALVLEAGTGELTPCSPPAASLPRKKISETYHVAAPNNETQLEVVTEFHGLSADSTRGYFRANTQKEIDKDFTQFYARRYPRVRTANPVEYEEISGENGCRVKEHYVIPTFWKITDDKSGYYVNLTPVEVDEQMGQPGSAERTDPLALDHPVNITQEIRAEMFEDWPLIPSNEDVANGQFQFQHRAMASGRRIDLTYSYRTLADRVSPADLAAYDAAVRKIKDAIGYNLTYKTPEQVTARRKADLKSGYGQFNWPIAVLASVILLGGLSGAGSYYYFACHRVAPLPPSLHSRQLEGLGGWLVVVAIGLFFRPFMFINACVALGPSIFHLDVWRNLTLSGNAAYHPLWMPILLFELTYNMLAVIFSLLLLVLFFQKRQAWPRCFIAFMVFMLCGVVIDQMLAANIPAVVKSGGGNPSKDLTQIFFAAAIWIPYTLRSERVRATFRR